MAANNLSVRIDVDVSEALTGLKAVQREAKKATQALRECEATLAKCELILSRELAEKLAKEVPPKHIGPIEITYNNGADLDAIARKISEKLKESERF